MNPVALAEELLNRASFGLRNRYWGKWKVRSGYPEQPDSKKEIAFYRLILKTADVQARASYGACTACIDIGCRNWSYAQALAETFAGAELIGIELDGGRRYWNLHRRIDCASAVAERLAKNGRSARALHADFLSTTRETLPNAAYGVFCFFYPFVSERPCRKWGIPARYSDFQAQLAHAKNLGASRIISCHQGEWEAEIAREAYVRAGLHPRESVLTPEDFKNLWPSRYPTHIFRVQSSL